MSLLTLDIDHCRRRQRRLLHDMERRRLDLVVVVRNEHVQWLTGVRYEWVFEPAAAIWADGTVVLVGPGDEPEAAAADSFGGYAAKRHSTMRNDQRTASAQGLLEAIGRRDAARRIGVEFSACGPSITSRLPGELVDIEPDLYRLRRRKEADELVLVRRAIAGTAAMYASAREIIEPGVSELDVFSQLQAAATREFKEMMTGTGNDYACGARGGPPRDRPAGDGELYILDLGPAYRGYFADNCRTLAVSGRATDAQYQAWEQIAAIFPWIESHVAPGVRCRDVFDEVQARLDQFMPGGFNHHLGHGIGLFPHEAPHLNPNWDDTFEVGDVFTAEPGLYSPELQAGIRLENDYLVTDDGVFLLSDFPLELA